MNEKKTKEKIHGKEVGLISVITVISQFISGNLSTKNVNDEIKNLRIEVSQMRFERAEHYVNKADFRVLEVKVDRANEQLSTLKSQTASIKTFLKSQLQYSLYPVEKTYFSLIGKADEHKRVN